MYDFCGIMPKNAATKDSYETQVRVLIQQFTEIKQQNNELNNQIKWKQQELDKLHEKLDELQKKHERLMLAYQLISQDKQERAFARKKIDSMVREIDTCLNLLLE